MDAAMPDIFEDEQVADIWADVMDITGDAETAKKVVLHLSIELWNLPWDKWISLHKQAMADLIG